MKTKANKDWTAVRDNILNWVTTEGSEVRCSFCKAPEVRADLQEILRAMTKLKKFNLSVPKIFAKLKADHPEFPTKSVNSLFGHLKRCEIELWNQARGK